MLFSIGTKVKFLHTADEGVVHALLDNGMVSVYLPKADMEIPAHPEDLIRSQDWMEQPVSANKGSKKLEKRAPEPPVVKIETQYAILKSNGIQLAFLPQINEQGLTETYTIYLLNDTHYEVVYDVKLLLNYKKLAWNGKLTATAYVKLGSMLYDDLNEAPEFEVEIAWITTAGKEQPVFKSLRIKPKSFFNALKTAPLLNKPTHLFRLFEKPSKKEDKKEEDLQAYTKRHARPTWYRGNDLKAIDAFEPGELAHFEPELDLHIENLVENWQKLSNAEILAIQLSSFETFLQKALRLGAPGVFIIHGVGKGKLRNEIATLLLKNPDVKTFKNEFHPKYGWGATEVIFEK